MLSPDAAEVDEGGAEIPTEDNDSSDDIKIGQVEEYAELNDAHAGQVEEQVEVEDEEMKDKLLELIMSDDEETGPAGPYEQDSDS